MTTATLTLTEFLLARIAEDEAAAQYSTAMWADVPSTARVLAECEAKRRIVEAFEEERVRRDIYNRAYDEGQLTTDDDLRSRLASNAKCRGLEIAMEAHAAVCADHPDFREEWRL